VTYAGPAFEPAAAEWTSPWPAENRDPLVVISFSTTYMDQRGMAERALEAVSTLPVRALLTAGPALDVGRLAIPANARAVSYVPHAAVFPHASLVVTHAGYGTIQAALAAGVPVVAMPDGRDQPDNAARVVEAGAGVRVRKNASAAKLRGAIAGALADGALKAAAERMAVALRRDGAGAVVDAVERAERRRTVAGRH
jgi:MGT family glycosyltransferase